MAYNLAIGDIIEVSFRGFAFGQETLNVRHYQVTTLGAPLDAATNFFQWKTAMAGANKVRQRLEQCCSNDWVLVDSVFQRIRPTRNSRMVFQEGVPGAVASQCHQLNTAGHIILLTDFATQRSLQLGKGMVGGFQVPAVPETFTLDGLVSNAGLTAYGNLATELASVVTGAAGNEISPVVFHRSQTGIVNSVTPITSWSVNPYIRTQKTRTVGKGI